VKKATALLLMFVVALSLGACGGGGSSSSSGASSGATDAGAGEAAGGAAKTPEEVWAKEVEGVMRQFENSSADSVALIHTNVSQYNLEPTYKTYSAELAKLGKELEATKPPPACEHLRERMGALSRKVSGILGVLAHQPHLSPEEYSALVFQQRYKFAHVGQKLTTITIEPHC
jgi:hypothetical protein